MKITRLLIVEITIYIYISPNGRRQYTRMNSRGRWRQKINDKNIIYIIYIMGLRRSCFLGGGRCHRGVTLTRYNRMFDQLPWILQPTIQGGRFRVHLVSSWLYEVQVHIISRDPVCCCTGHSTATSPALPRSMIIPSTVRFRESSSTIATHFTYPYNKMFWSWLFRQQDAAKGACRILQ